MQSQSDVLTKFLVRTTPLDCMPYLMNFLKIVIYYHFIPEYFTFPFSLPFKFFSTFTNDHYGRIVKVEASDLKYGEVKRNQYAQSNSGKPDRLLDDDGGHLIATIFKGSGDIDNLLPMNSQINRSGGKWYEMEQKWKKALTADPPKHVEVKIEPVYMNDSLRPAEFLVEYKIGDQKRFRTIKNKPGG